MTEPYPATAREAIILFHFCDRMKAELLIASRLLGGMLTLQGEQQEGGKSIFLEYLQALEQEIGMGCAQITVPEMVRVKTVVTGLLGMADGGLYQDMQEHLTWMVTVMTTHAQRALEFLFKEKLM